MKELQHLYLEIVKELKQAGSKSLYKSDADEHDPRYKSYGVRAKEKKLIFLTFRPKIRCLIPHQQIELANLLVKSEVGDQQTIGLSILEPLASMFTPQKFDDVDGLVRCLHGWSKVDAFTGSFLRDILIRFPTQFLHLVDSWNQDPDMWLKRTSVVLFTRKIAKSGQFNDFAFKMCENLVDDEEALVQKGVGWALKDLMHADKDRVLDYVGQLRKQKKPGTIILYAIKNLKGKERADFLASS